MLTVTVSQLNRYIKATLEEDNKLAGIIVKGEITNFTNHFRSGHLYFTLRDSHAAVRAVMFKSHAQRLRFEPEEGMAVLVQGNIGVFERDGAYQLYATDIQPDGAGALAVAFEQLKAKLQAEGLFEEACKKPIPPYPRRIGVVTSETGAALQDIINVLTRRYPLATLTLSPALVQGAQAPSSLIRALKALDDAGHCDVIILGRGGGSAEDLWAFNDEKLARAVFRARTPVVSAVGHEVDFTICDFVADVRAPTPSAAAELVTPDAEQLAGRLASHRLALRQQSARMLRERFAELELLRNKMGTPRKMLTKYEELLDFYSSSLYNKKCMFIQRGSAAVKERAALLNSLSPLRVLERGYALAERDGGAVTDAKMLAVGDSFQLRFRDGTVTAQAQRIITGEQNEANNDI